MTEEGYQPRACAFAYVENTLSGSGLGRPEFCSGLGSLGVVRQGGVRRGRRQLLARLGSTQQEPL